ncbi:outer membrane protein assembly factor BamB family protein [Streptomyces altiplanensis]
MRHRPSVRLRASVTAAVALAALLAAPGAAPRAATALPGRTATAAETTDATLGYRVDPARSSAVAGATAAPPYRKLWSRDLGSAVSAPVAVGDRLFAVVNADQGDEGGPRMQLVGLDARTGKNLWPAKHLTDRPGASLSYGGGLVYTQTQDGVLTAWDPAAGARRWSVRLNAPDSHWFHYPPVWYKGVLYTHSGYASTAMAVRASDGHTLWSTPLANVGQVPVAVNSQGVWVAFDDIEYYLLDHATGRTLRHYVKPPGYSGSSGSPAVLGGGKLWMRGTSPDGTLTGVDRATGELGPGLAADGTPAYTGNRLFVAKDGAVRAVDTRTDKTLWTYRGTSEGIGVRLVAAGHVYAAGGDWLRVLRASDGRLVWSLRLAPGDLPPGFWNGEDDGTGWVVPGLATAKGRLFVPVANGALAGYAS